MDNYTEEIILDNINLFTIGCVKDINVSNVYSSWKNTYKGLKTIIHKKKDFYIGVNLWLEITRNQILLGANMGSNTSLILFEIGV